MLRITQSEEDAGHPSRRKTAVRMALALSALAAIPIVASAAVSSLTLSSTDIASGGSATGTVTLDATAALGSVIVTLTSSSPAVATVPASVLVRRGARAVSFTVSAPAGAAGCTSITGRVGTTPAKSRILYVRPPPASGAPFLEVRFSTNPTASGVPLTGTVSIVQGSAGGPFTVQLSSSNPAVASVPASVTVSLTQMEGGFLGSASFPIQTTDVGASTCAVITARVGTARGAALLKLHSIGG